MRTLMVAAALLLALAGGPALAQKSGQNSGEPDGNADVLNSLMLKAGERCYALAGEERSTCCARYFDNLCGTEIAATAAPATPAAAPPASVPTAPAASRATAPRAGNSSGDGPADVLNGFVMKELQQCRALLPHERRPCCERLLHPNACVEP